jgi:hypothetical protein
MALGALLSAQQPAAQPQRSTENSSDASVVPRLIRHNGVYQTSGQQAQSGATGIAFSIYRQQFDGTPLWSEIQNVQLDKDGRYTVLLGSTISEGMPVDLFTTPEPRWLEVEVNQVKQPRVLLSSVPYAMKAVDAETLGGLPASAYMRVGTPTAVAVPSAANSSTPAASGLSPLITNGTPSYIAMFMDSTSLGNSAIYQSGNAVSIGGTANLGAMTLIGNAPFTDTAGLALYNMGGGVGASVSLDMYNTSYNGGIPQAKIKALDDGSYSDHLTFWTKTPGGQNNPLAERMRITSNGNVGIGTATPGATLEVAGNLKLSGQGDFLMFPDGTIQSTATVSGSRGPQGPQGPTGPMGLMGATGPAGVAGPTGTQGLQGVQGIAGPTGQTGAAGPTGAVGPTGAQGTQGLQGLQGVQGPTGAVGPTGSQGTQGLQGAQGPTGAAGPTGSQGTQGLQGAQGPTGPAGPSGSQGTQGLQGSQGLQGLSGAAATVSIGTTTTGAPGSNALVTNSGTQNAAILNFTIPQGAAGAAGGGSAVVYTLGNSPSSPIPNGGTISGTSALYFIADGATVTLPAATTLGQALIFIDIGNDMGNGISAKAITNELVFDIWNSQSGSSQSESYYGMSLVSDGNHHWYVYNVN